jgi:pimeloyl-ACP methyl ester carboxylesterase
MMKTKIQTQDKHVMVQSLRFHYREWGSASAPPLLVLHGLTGHAWEFDGVASALADQYHVLAVNQRGHGASSWGEEYSPTVMADDIAALLDILGLDRVRVIGHSMGGVNSWWLAARHPERVERLVILDADPKMITSDQLVSGWMVALDVYAQSQYTGLEEAVQEYLAGYTGLHQQELHAFAINNLKVDPEGYWTWRFDARGLVGWLEHASSDEEAHWSALRQLACPVLVVRAGDSPFTNTAAAECMVREISRARLIEIPGTGHDIHIDQHDALLAALWPFLSADWG